MDLMVLMARSNLYYDLSSTSLRCDPPPFHLLLDAEHSSYRWLVGCEEERIWRFHATDEAT